MGPQGRRLRAPSALPR